MQISQLRILNYKGFGDSGWISIPKGFTVVVGQNNSGKTALLEAFRLSALPTKPHRSLAREEGTPLAPISRVEVKLDTTGPELLQSILTAGQPTYIPYPPGQVQPPREYLDELFARSNLTLNLTAQTRQVLRSPRQTILR
ncbi:AAA family ATPase [Bradyrhizobium tropiciagri]|uniref:AAA family ATPase n=1 Tax=Bradyrhizobium tropiciagri TaxID=312253 RepID=UPI001BA4F3DA|nr:AAA family ATPase [Bradyrhizobium tropiciagri]